MKRTFLLALFSFLFSFSFAQDDCYHAWKKAFDERGAYPLDNGMHRKVYIAFQDGDSFYCVEGKVRYENGVIEAYWLFYADGTPELQDVKFSAAKGGAPKVTNGISELIKNDNGEYFYVIFVDTLKPKGKPLKIVGGPPQ